MRAALRNDAVSEAGNRRIVPSRAATSTTRSASHNHELVTTTPASVPRQPRDERYSKTSRRQFAWIRPARSSPLAHQSRMTAARPLLCASFDAFRTAWTGAPAGLPSPAGGNRIGARFIPFFHLLPRSSPPRRSRCLHPRLPLASIKGYGIVSAKFKYA
jgi:hypothetical protein